MKFLFDLFPVIVFFVGYQLADDSHTGILYGTGAAIVASFLQVGYLWIRGRRIENMYWITLILLVVLGGATLALQDERFIKWKPTAVNWVFALAFLGSAVFTRKNLLRRMLEHTVTLPDPIWTRLNLAWVAFFLFSGCLNLIIAYNFATDVWVNFKLFGMVGLTIAFAIGQGFYLARHVKEVPQPGNSGG
jgi:intracellular septation protein